MSGEMKLMKKNYFDRVRELLVSITGNEEFLSISTSDNILYVGFNSMAAVRLFMGLEQKYGFQIDANDFSPRTLNTIDNINNMLLRYIDNNI